MDIKPKIESLLESANLVTGQERDNLTDAIQDLADGYGQGGTFLPYFFVSEDTAKSTTQLVITEARE